MVEPPNHATAIDTITFHTKRHRSVLVSIRFFAAAGCCCRKPQKPNPNCRFAANSPIADPLVRSSNLCILNPASTVPCAAIIAVVDSKTELSEKLKGHRTIS